MEKFDSYDPVTYSKPASEMAPDLIHWVDTDHIEVGRRRMSIQEDAGVEEATSDESIVIRSLPVRPVFNTEQTITLHNGVEIVVDRTSYIHRDGEPLKYEVDALGMPRNPMGRTGLRGRGNLLRWGPNHAIAAVISRWRPGTSGQKDKPTMEFLVLTDPTIKDGIRLPGEFIYRDSSPYSVMCEAMLEQVCRETKPQTLPPDYDAEQMIQFFSKFISPDNVAKRPPLYANFGYSAFPVYKGYMDDRANSDNAWKEAEIWNFHYKYKDSLDAKIKDNEYAMWIPLEDHMPLSNTEMRAVKEAAMIHNGT